MVLGCLAFVVAGGLLAGGATLAVLQGTLQDDDGFFMSADEELRTSTHAITSVNLETEIADGAAFVPDRLLGDIRLSVAPLGDEDVFVGIGPTDEVAAYLADVGHTVVVDFDSSGIGGGDPVYVDAPGGAPETAPADAIRWSAQSSGSGTQDLVWSLEDGDWTVVVMNADGSADVAVDVAVGAEFPAMWWVIAMLCVPRSVPPGPVGRAHLGCPASVRAVERAVATTAGRLG